MPTNAREADDLPSVSASSALPRNYAKLDLPEYFGVDRMYMNPFGKPLSPQETQSDLKKYFGLGDRDPSEPPQPDCVTPRALTISGGDVGSCLNTPRATAFPTFALAAARRQ